MTTRMFEFRGGRLRAANPPVWLVDHDYDGDDLDHFGAHFERVLG